MSVGRNDISALEEISKERINAFIMGTTIKKEHSKDAPKFAKT